MCVYFFRVELPSRKRYTSNSPQKYLSWHKHRWIVPDSNYQPIRFRISEQPGELQRLWNLFFVFCVYLGLVWVWKRCIPPNHGTFMFGNMMIND